jgi:hypothetical protein
LDTESGPAAGGTDGAEAHIGLAINAVLPNNISTATMNFENKPFRALIIPSYEFSVLKKLSD